MFGLSKKSNKGEAAARSSLKRPAVEEATSMAADSAIVGGLLRSPEAANIERGRSALAEIDAAIDADKVALDNIVVAHHLVQLANDLNGHDYGSKITVLWTVYTKRCTVLQKYFCTYIPAAVVLRRVQVPRGVWILKRVWERGVLVIDDVYRAEASRKTEPDVEAAFWEARSCYLYAHQCRGARRRESILRDIFSVMINLLTLADADAMPGCEHGRAAKTLPNIQGDLRQVKSKIQRALLIEARHRYLAGMLAGALIIGAGVIVIVRLVLTFTHVSIDTLGLGVAIAGGAGALLSVMTRLTTNNLQVDQDAGPRLVLLAGSFRPVIGAIFAFAVYMFIEGDLIPIKVTATGRSATYFFLGIGFLAGFSERFAQDAVTRAGTIMSDTGPLAEPASPPEAPSRSPETN